MKKRILISEIFGPVLQGEGALIGRPTIFVRTGGCDFRCSWCDTLYAVLPQHRSEWQSLSAEEILNRVRELSGGQPMLITLSGGNPALQPLEPLIEAGLREGFTFALETQGSVAQSWFAKLQYLVLSPKPPSSGMSTDWEKLQQCLDAAQSSSSSASTLNAILKIVVFDDADFQYARHAAQRLPQLPVFLQAGNPLPTPLEAATPEAIRQVTRQRLEWLLQCSLEAGWPDVTILPQLHVLLWGNRRGV